MRNAYVVSGLLAAILATTARAQAPDSISGGSARADSAPAGVVATPPSPAPPTPEQVSYLQGLQRVGRGIAQLKTALEQVNRSQAAGDSVSQRRASRRLGGYCGSAASFMRGGRAQMRHTAYADSARMRAQRLGATVDELLKYTPTCEAEAGGATARVTAEVAKRIQAYDTALVQFRSAIAPPASREPSVPSPAHPPIPYTLPPPPPPPPPPPSPY
jgi:hypothetical protein